MAQQLPAVTEKKQQATALLAESLDRLNVIRFRVHQENAKNPQKPLSTYFEEFVQLVDKTELMIVMAGRIRAYFFSSPDSWIYLERDADSASHILFIVREKADGVLSVQKTVC
uniref:Cyclic nucleotide-binding domain-containing protein n=1 Tax=Steinernema glaseri TaxID=37863 RepID=A0A1I7ZG95_9BILA